jgi:hypothetical protein
VMSSKRACDAGRAGTGGCPGEVTELETMRCEYPTLATLSQNASERPRKPKRESA